MDYIIKNGWIVNGKNEKPFYGDLAVKNGKIEEVGEHIEVPSDFSGKCVLDAAGGYVTPGFIDIHRHGDWQAFGNGDDELLNRQGLTTVVNGNCGLSVAPVGEKFREEIAGFLSSVTGEVRQGQADVMSTMSSYLAALSKEKRSVNTGMLAGNGTIRAGVKGYAPGKLSDEEMHQVWNALEESLAAGALGVSLGVAYAPEFEYDRDGLAQALQPLKGTGIPITTHVRNEGDGILLALQEVISVAEELQIPLHVSHLKCIGQKNWGDTPVKILQLFDQAAERGVKVDFDLYPYLTGSTQLVHLLPPRAAQTPSVRDWQTRHAGRKLPKYCSSPRIFLKTLWNWLALSGFMPVPCIRSSLEAMQASPFRLLRSSWEKILMIPFTTFFLRSAVRLPCWIPSPPRRICFIF